MADIVVFGVKDLATLAYFYLRHDSPHKVVAFTVHEQYMPDKRRFEDRPVVPFERLASELPPNQVKAFAPLTHRNMNADRAAVYAALKSSGYELISYVSSRATMFPETTVGDNCFILEDNTIQPFVTIGSDVVLWSGNHIGHHSVIGDHVFFTSHVVLSGHCVVEPYCFFGVNATIRDQLTLGEGTFVGMGACVTRNTEPWSVLRAEAARPARVSSKELDA